MNAPGWQDRQQETAVIFDKHEGQGARRFAEHEVRLRKQAAEADDLTQRAECHQHQREAESHAKPSVNARPTEFLEAKASARPIMEQLVTIRGMKIPSTL